MLYAGNIPIARSIIVASGAPADVGNGRITINQGGETKGTFTVNQSNNTTIELDSGLGNIDGGMANSIYTISQKIDGGTASASIIQIRRDTAANWTIYNPVLAQGEVAWEIGTDNYKIGDGVTAWNNLRYIQFGEIPNDGKLIIQKNGTTVAEFTANYAGEDVIANIETTSSYTELTDKPSLNGVTINGAMVSSDLGIPTLTLITNTEIDALFSGGNS